MSQLEVRTVDGFQGREKEAMIISLTRSNDKGIGLFVCLSWLCLVNILESGYTKHLEADMVTCM